MGLRCIAALVGAALLVGCANQEPTSPEDSVTQFHQMLGDAQYEKACELLATDLQVEMAQAPYYITLSQMLTTGTTPADLDPLWQESRSKAVQPQEFCPDGLRSIAQESLLVGALSGAVVTDQGDTLAIVETDGGQWGLREDGESWTIFTVPWFSEAADITSTDLP